MLVIDWGELGLGDLRGFSVLMNNTSFRDKDRREETDARSRRSRTSV